MEKPQICIIGLGYVGLPLAYAFAKKGYEVIGHDISSKRIEELNGGHDRTDELTDEQLQEVSITYSDDSASMSDADVIIVAIPTPVDENNKPDLSMIEKGSETIGSHMKKGCIVVYESTVYPGTTEEICGPILEKASGMKCGEDFKLGYSPERINPGDKEHTIDKIVKVVAGQDEETADVLCELYGSIITVGVHRAPNIKVAEMAKAIENAQRDLNIAFVNEIAILSHKVGIRSKDVFDAAKTKWNFLPFQPGLVGGHCIGVDPYYLVEKARQLGMETHVIAAGRAVNEGMICQSVVDEVCEALPADPSESKVLVLGITFKEDVPDTRNSKAFHVVKLLQEKGCSVEIHDPEVADDEWERFDTPRGALGNGTQYDAVLLLVPHKEYRETELETFLRSTKEGGVIYDLKSILNEQEIEKAGKTYLAL